MKCVCVCVILMLTYRVRALQYEIGFVLYFVIVIPCEVHKVVDKMV